MTLDPIAEAGLSLNDIFLAAENACAQYIENIERLSSEQERACARLEAESRADYCRGN